MGKIGDLFVRLGLKSDDYKKGMADAKKETTSFSQSLGKMKAGALAVWAAIGSAVTIFARDFMQATNTMGDAWASAMSGMKASYHSVIADMTNYKPDFSSFRAFFKNEWDWIKKTFGNAKEAGDAAAEMTKAFDAEFELTQSVRLQRQAVQQELNELYIKAMDTTVSAADRKAAADKYKTLLQPIADAEVRVYGNMLNEAVKAWQAGNELDRQYSTEELKEFFTNIGTAYEDMEKKFPDLMRVYETRKGDAQNIVIFDTISKLQTAENQMSEIDKSLARINRSINRSLTEFGGEANVPNPAEALKFTEALPALPAITSKAIGGATGLNTENHYANLMADGEEYAQWYMGMLDRVAQMNAMLEDSIIQATTAGMEAFTDMLFGIEGADASAILGALMQPFADTATQLGGMLLAQGLAVDAFKTSLASLQGAPAIAAGLSLIAIGAAMKSGIKALAKGGGGTGSTASYGGSSYGSTAAQNYESTLTVNVVGHISGSDIALSLDRTRKNQKR